MWRHLETWKRHEGRLEISRRRSCPSHSRSWSGDRAEKSGCSTTISGNFVFNYEFILLIRLSFSQSFPFVLVLRIGFSTSQVLLSAIDRLSTCSTTSNHSVFNCVLFSLCYIIIVFCAHQIGWRQKKNWMLRLCGSITEIVRDHDILFWPVCGRA